MKQLLKQVGMTLAVLVWVCPSPMRVQTMSLVEKPLDNDVDPDWNSNYHTQRIAENLIRTSAAEGSACA